MITNYLKSHPKCYQINSIKSTKEMILLITTGLTTKHFTLCSNKFDYFSDCFSRGQVPYFFTFAIENRFSRLKNQPKGLANWKFPKIPQNLMIKFLGRNRNKILMIFICIIFTTFLFQKTLNSACKRTILLLACLFDNSRCSKNFQASD